jgi:outer membrane protein OmpA-like peptidoglycan-associated protein
VTPPGGRPAGGGLPPAAAGNRPPTVRAICDPCTVEVGRTSTVSADAQDPDGDPLRYAWRTAQGTLANTVNRQTLWTAPMQVGPVPVTVSVDDGRGGTASDTVTINVIAAAARNLVFEDVHFDFDRFSLRDEAIKELDDVVKALNATPTLRLEIEGYTCNIGTAQYNLALGERRARSVRDYLISRGISAERLHTVSYGEERPKHDNDREETRMLNRRAALVVRIQ